MPDEKATANAYELARPGGSRSSKRHTTTGVRCAEGQHEVIDWLGPGQAMNEIAAKMKETTGPKLPAGLDVVGFGHSIGLGIHDRPFITMEDDRLTEPNMVMQIEHVTTDGHEMYHAEDSVLFHESGVTLLSDYTDTKAMYVIE